MSSSGKRGALVCLVVAASIVVASPASATVTSGVVAGVLTVTSDDNDDSIAIGCIGGNVVVNGAYPLSGVMPCAEIIEIVADGNGGSDLVTLEAVTTVDFPSIRSITVRGGDGADTLIGSDLDESMYGGADDDALSPGLGNEDLIDGGVGFDEVRAVALLDVVLTDEVLSGSGIYATLRGVESAVLVGSPAENTFDASGFSGTTSISPLGGRDVVTGGSASDTIAGSEGNDTLRGGPGDDLLQGQEGDDLLFGGAGLDRLRGGPGTDGCRGGPGLDVITGCE